MLHDRANEGKPVDEEWHLRRQDARETAFSPEEFSPQERERFDLDDAGITGEDNPETFHGQDRLNPDVEGDIRDVPWR